MDIPPAPVQQQQQRRQLWCFLMKKDVAKVDLMTPKGILLHLTLEEINRGDGEVTCAVRKDGGDDPDATTGADRKSVV